MKRYYGVRVAEPHHASLPGNGGRGLKPQGLVDIDEESGRIAPRQRGAWIETLIYNIGAGAWAGCIAPRQRGAWIETGWRVLRRMRGPVHRSPATGGVD